MSSWFCQNLLLKAFQISLYYLAELSLLRCSSLKMISFISRIYSCLLPLLCGFCSSLRHHYSLVMPLASAARLLDKKSRFLWGFAFRSILFLEVIVKDYLYDEYLSLCSEGQRRKIRVTSFFFFFFFFTL